LLIQLTVNNPLFNIRKNKSLREDENEKVRSNSIGSTRFNVRSS